MTAANPFGEPPPGGDGATTVLIMLARVEGKLDVVAAQHGAQLTEHARRLDDQARRVEEVDDRVRAQEEVRAAPRIGRLEEQVESLKASRWPLPSLAALVAVASLVLALLGFLSRT